MFVENLLPNVMFEADNGANGGGQEDQNQAQPNNGVNHDQNNGQGSQNTPKADGQQDGDAHQQNKNEHMIPKSRFDEVNNKLKELQAQLDNINKQKQKEELENKKKRGEFEELYNTTAQELEQTKTQYEQTSQRVQVLEGLIQSLVDAELEAVPEEMRDLVPENFTPEQKLSWITNAKKKGLFGSTTNSKENQPLGDSTNTQNQHQQLDFSKMSVTDLFRRAYGSKR